MVNALTTKAKAPADKHYRPTVNLDIPDTMWPGMLDDIIEETPLPARRAKAPVKAPAAHKAPAPKVHAMPAVPVLTPETIKEVIATIAADAAVNNRWRKAADLLRAEGVTSERLKSDEGRAYYHATLVYPSFTLLEVALYQGAAKGLSTSELGTKKHVASEIGARYGKICRHVAKSEADELTQEESKSYARKSIGTNLSKVLDGWTKKIENADSVDFSATLMLEYLRKARALIKNS
jgi:hypothetical protein